MANANLVKLSSLSREFVRYQVTAREGPSGNIDPTSFPVEAAFPADEVEPAGGDWVSASWETPEVGPRYFARCLVGPGGTITLSNGTYDAWIRITTGTEVVIKKVGVLIIT